MISVLLITESCMLHYTFAPKFSLTQRWRVAGRKKYSVVKMSRYVEYDEKMFSAYLKLYYKRIFPFNHYFKWLSYGLGMLLTALLVEKVWVPSHSDPLP